MDNDSGGDGTDELRELGWEEWEKEWSGLGWRNEAGSLFRTQDDFFHFKFIGFGGAMRFNEYWVPLFYLFLLIIN